MNLIQALNYFFQIMLKKFARCLLTFPNQFIFQKIALESQMRTANFNFLQRLISSGNFKLQNDRLCVYTFYFLGMFCIYLKKPDLVSLSHSLNYLKKKKNSWTSVICSLIIMIHKKCVKIRRNALRRRRRWASEYFV